MNVNCFLGFCFVEVSNSSNILGFGYDVFKDVLRVQYKDQACYDYRGVGPSIVLGLYQSYKSGLSVGKYVHIHIKDKFETDRVEQL